MMTSRRIRQLVIAVVSCAAICAAAGYITGDYFVDYALRRGSDADALAPPAACASIHDQSVKIPAAPAAAAEKWSIAHDGIKLAATYYAPSQITHGRSWVILVHGYGRDQRYVSDYVRAYLDKNWNVLTPDLCASGESGGQYITMGVKESEEIVLWADKIHTRDPNARIVLHGLSMGAATVLMSAGKYTVPGLAAIIEDCSYTDAYEMFGNQLGVLFGLPEFPIMNCVDLVSAIKTGARMSDASPLSIMPKIKVPVMFIHGGADTLVPPSMMERLYESCNAPKKKLLVADAGHAEAMQVAGDDYWSAVFSFVESR